MQFTDHNREYRLVRKYNEKPNGMSLEMMAVAENKSVAKVFYLNDAGDFTISIFESDLHLTAVEQLISFARVALLPVTKVHDR
jgi:hypothetical protein